MTLGEIIKQFRTKHSISMAEFAKMSNLSKAYVGILEKNVNPSTGRPVVPSIATIKHVSLATGIDFDELVKMIDSDQLVSLDLPTTSQILSNECDEEFDVKSFDRIANRFGFSLKLEYGVYVLRKGRASKHLDRDEVENLINQSFTYIEYLCDKLMQETTHTTEIRL